MNRLFIEPLRQKTRFLCLILLFMCPCFLAAALLSPANDDFSGRIRLGPGNVQTNGTMLGASQESGERWLMFIEQRSVWWVWSATNSGPVTIVVDAVSDDLWSFSSFFSIEVSVGDSIVQLNPVASGASSVIYNDHLVSSVTFQAVSGTSYVIGLIGRGDVGRYTLDVGQGLPPMAMVAAPHAGAVFKSGESIRLSAQVLDPDSPVSNVTFYVGWGLHFSQMGTVQEWPFEVNWSNAVPGHYQVVARGWDSTGLSAFSLPIAIDVVPRNDAFADRVALPGVAADVTGSLENASREEGEPWHVDNELDSIWWSWTAPTNGFVTVSSDTWGVAVYTGSTLDTLSLVTNGSTSGQGAVAVFAATKGTAYAIAAIGYGEIHLRLRMSRPPVVTIVSPLNGATYIEGDPIPVHVNAEDPEGNLVSLEVWENAWSSHEEWVNPFKTNLTVGSLSVVLQDLPAGRYGLGAKATDADGLTTWRVNQYFDVLPPPIPTPPNDHYTNRLTITGAPLVVNGTTAGATTELGEAGYRSVWWRWVAPASGPTTVTFDSYPHSANIYTGDAPSASECVGRASFFVGSGREVFQAQAGVAYQIRVYLHAHFLESGEVRFQILQSATPTVSLTGPSSGSHFTSGDIFQVSATVTGIDWGISKVDLFSSGNVPETFTNGPYTVPISFQTDYTTTRDVYAVVTDTMGWSYRSATFTYTIQPVPPVPPANDAYADRLALSGSSVSATGTTENATRESGEHEGTERSVWYSWIAPADGNYTITVDGWMPNPGILAYTGITMPTLALAGSSTIEPGPERPRARLTLNAVAGTLYQVAVRDAGAFSLTVSPGRPPSISITSPGDGTTVLRGSPTAFAVSVNDPDGDLRKVDFYLNHTLLATVTNLPFSVEFTAQGLLLLLDGIREKYFLDAVATDEQGSRTHALSVAGDIEGAAVHSATNDNFANRILLTGLLAGGRLDQEATASVEMGEPDWLEDGRVGSTWWSWRAPAASEVIIHCEAPFAVLTGHGTALNNLTLAGVSQPSEWIHVSRFTAVAGAEYHIRVGTDYPIYRLQILLSAAQAALLSAHGGNKAMSLDFQTLAPRDWIFYLSENLEDWFPFYTNRSRLQNLRVLDSITSSQIRRFYRAQSQP